MCLVVVMVMVSVCSAIDLSSFRENQATGVIPFYCQCYQVVDRYSLRKQLFALAHGFTGASQGVLALCFWAQHDAEVHTGIGEETWDGICYSF